MTAPKLKLGTILEYISVSKHPCVAKVIKVSDKDFTIKVLTCNGSKQFDGDDKITVDNQFWEINQFRIRLQIL